MLYEVLFFQAQEPAVTDYDVVVELDTHHAPGFDKFAGDVNIALAGGGVAAGVVVGHDDGGGAFLDCGLEYFARVDDVGVEAAHGYGLLAQEPVLGVQVQGDE